MRVLEAHRQSVIGVIGVDGDAVALLVGSVEEFGDVAQLPSKSFGTPRS